MNEGVPKTDGKEGVRARKSRRSAGQGSALMLRSHGSQLRARCLACRSAPGGHESEGRAAPPQAEPINKTRDETRQER